MFVDDGADVFLGNETWVRFPLLAPVFCNRLPVDVRSLTLISYFWAFSFLVGCLKND